MISERDRIAAKYRSEGQGEAADIMGQKQKELERIQSEAYKTAEQLKGDADAQAIQIYAQSHGKRSGVLRVYPNAGNLSSYNQLQYQADFVDR